MAIKERPDRIALFIDLENFVGFCLGLGLPIDLTPELNRLTELGKVTVRRSFGDIYKLPIPNEQKSELRKMLQRNLVQHEDIPYQNAFKNAADIRLVIDALTLAYTNEDIDMVAVVASDRDYLPLYAKLCEIGKEIIGIGGSRDNTPELFVKACDYFFYHEVLTGRAASGLAADVIHEEMAEPLLPLLTSSPQPGAPIGTDERRSDVAASSKANREEVVQLLLDAMQALESKGNSVHHGSGVSQMMRRLKADFDLSAYGYSSFKQLCERAAAAGLIIIEHNGVAFNLRLNTAEETQQGSSMPLQVNGASGETTQAQLQRWLEGKIRVRLPSREERETIYHHLSAVMQQVDRETGVSLLDITERVRHEITNQESSQAVCYKVLYSLYRANCFSCSQGPTVFNPVIHEMRVDAGDHDLCDNRFIENNLRVYARECRAVIDPVAWSSVFFGTGAYAERIRDIARSL
jgi:uncharacterized LabA/DUF88 family protein